MVYLIGNFLGSILKLTLKTGYFNNQSFDRPLTVLVQHKNASTTLRLIFRTDQISKKINRAEFININYFDIRLLGIALYCLYACKTTVKVR